MYYSTEMQVQLMFIGTPASTESDLLLSLCVQQLLREKFRKIVLENGSEIITITATYIVSNFAWGSINFPTVTLEMLR